METENPNTQTEEPEGLDDTGGSWGDYPLDQLRIRSETRTVFDAARRIDQGLYGIDPDCRRDCIWPEDKQSRLIESVLLRLPLPAFYMAEDREWRPVVLDGLQRLSALQGFLKGELRLRIPERQELHGKRFDDLLPKFQNRIEDCQLTFHIIDADAPERACLDIIERVNGGAALSRQQMRNCLHTGPAARFLKQEAQTAIFSSATGGSLNAKTMRDREFVNRFCAFRILGPEAYPRDDMDGFLAECLEEMNRFADDETARLSEAFRRGLANNFELFGKQAFRKHAPGEERRGVLNASLWDALSVGLADYPRDAVKAHAEPLRRAVWELLADPVFAAAITDGPNGPGKVETRFRMSRAVFEKILGPPCV